MIRSYNKHYLLCSIRCVVDLICYCITMRQSGLWPRRSYCYSTFVLYIIFEPSITGRNRLCRQDYTHLISSTYGVIFRYYLYHCSRFYPDKGSIIYTCTLLSIIPGIPGIGSDDKLYKFPGSRGVFNIVIYYVSRLQTIGARPRNYNHRVRLRIYNSITEPYFPGCF